MARYKEYSYQQGKFLPVSFHEQIVPGTFEYALNYIIDHHMNLSVFEDRYRNDQTGAPAFDPAVMLKIILYAYSLGITSSRQMEKLCATNITFMALSADTRPHFTTIAQFVSSLEREISSLFADVLLICAEENLIGKQMFAIDGCKLSSNCSKEWSGTKSDLEKKKHRIERSVDFLVKKHQAQDKQDPCASSMIEKEKKALKNLREKAAKIQRWLDSTEDKQGARGSTIKSNITDNESAKMTSSHGVIQGYNGIAAVDDKHQVIVHAEAHGSGSEHQTLESMIDGLGNNLEKIGEKDVLKQAIITADTGFHSEKNLQRLSERGLEAYLADNQFRKRDPDFLTAERHRKPIDRKHTIKKNQYFRPSDFSYDETKGKLICPAGKELYLKNSNFSTAEGLKGISYMGRKTDCRACELRKKCLRNEQTPARQVTIFTHRTSGARETFTSKMIRAFDSARGRFYYSRRMGTVEPVFANLRNNLGLDRFSLRGRSKVDTQWKLYCMVHNLGKFFRYGGQPA